MSTPALLTSGPDQAVRVADLVRQAAQLVPALRARAAEAEGLRRIPVETVADLVNSGLLRIATPTRYGGYGFDYDATLEVIVELDRGCGSTAWCFSIWSSHNWGAGGTGLSSRKRSGGGRNTASSWAARSSVSATSAKLR
jgi:alkylation response protein AidB-like acyl-CoA dehydrogenase